MIEIKNLTKSFNSELVIDRLNLQIGVGEILGFLGENGAGKTTTMRMLTGFLAPSSGDAIILGNSVVADPMSVQANLGYLPEGSPLYSDMRVMDFLRFMGGIRGIAGKQLDTRISQIVAEFSLEAVLTKKIEILSKGFKRRVGFAGALVHDPKVLILDEPTDGLDPNQKFHSREFIKSIAKNKIIIISTHLLDEVAAICTRVVLLHQGRAIIDESTGAFKQRGEQLEEVFFSLTRGK